MSIPRVGRLSANLEERLYLHCSEKDFNLEVLEDSLEDAELLVSELNKLISKFNKTESENWWKL